MCFASAAFKRVLRIRHRPEFRGLLPNNQVSDSLEKRRQDRCLLYKDSEDRLIATTAVPCLQMGEVAALKVKDITNIGAFLDWGL